MSAITAVIVTQGRSTWLLRCLESLAQAAVGSPSTQLAIRICINGTDPRSSAVSSEFASSHPSMDVSVRELAHRLLPGAARNGLAESIRTEWTYFIDDDAYVEPGFFAFFEKLQERNPEAVAIGGPNLTPPSSGLFERAAGIALSSRFATFLSNCRYRQLGAARSCGEESLILCSLFVRTRVLGPEPFPPDVFCGEENVLLERLARGGERLIHVPELAVLHERRGKARLLARQVFFYGRSRSIGIRNGGVGFRAAHAIPSCCVLYTIAFGALASLGRGWSLWAASPFWLYASIAGGAALASTRRAGAGARELGLSVLLFPVIHVSYGVGFLAGLFADTTASELRA